MTQSSKLAGPFPAGAASDVGLVRSENQDAWGAFPVGEGGLYLVCDGVGGRRGGRIASGLVVDAVGESFAGAPPGDPERSWVEAVEAALHALASRGREEPELAGMATTLVGLLLLPGQEDWAGSCANIGDSRLYRFRAGEVRRITTDHTVPQDLLRVGTITADEASAHPLSHVLTRALSADAPAEPEVISLRAAPGDRFLLCSDGVTASMEDGELAGLAGETAPDEFALELVHQANARGGQDNATALVVDLPEGRM